MVNKNVLKGKEHKYLNDDDDDDDDGEIPKKHVIKSSAPLKQVSRNWSRYKTGHSKS